MIVVPSHPDLLVQYKPGRSRTLVISFAGRGGKKNSFNRPVNEFYRLAIGENENHVLFIQDTSNSWMNGEGIAEGICDVITKLLTKIDVPRVVTLGNSMGGTMALLIAQIIKIDAAIAIAPQFSADPKIVPQDRRWMNDRRKISNFRFPDVLNVPFDKTRAIVMHGGQNEDRFHAELFPRHDELTHFIFPDYGHDLASKLHKAGKLAPIVTYAIAMRPRRTRQALSAACGVRREKADF